MVLKLTIAEIKPLTERISAFVLDSADGTALPDWTPGAHIDVSTDAGARSYSLISWPDDTDNRYHIAVQCEPDGDGGSRAMHALAQGDIIEATAPSNDFELLDDGRPTALLAGGIGVTPLISMATKLASNGRPFVFHYAGRSAGLMAYLDRLKTAFGEAFNAHFDDQAPLDLPALVSGISGHALYICGPKGMIEAARTAAESAGIDAANIHVELFTTVTAGKGDTAFEVELSSSGQVIEVAADKTIIEALEDAGVDLIYDCQRGDCGICQTDVVSGEPDHRDVVLSQAEKDGGKVMQICVSRALSERLVLDL